MCKVIGYDSFSELPGIHLGTCWTVRIAMLSTGKKKSGAPNVDPWIHGQHNLQLQIAVMSRSICLLAVSANVAAALPKVAKPNFVWLHVESTDGRTYQESMKDIVPIPRIRSLMQKGVNFVNAYANVPICCPSRASVWAGREGHNMKHTRKDNGLVVNGAWNNNEGFGFEGDEFDTKKISDRLAQQANYTLKILGKEDWLTGGTR